MPCHMRFSEDPHPDLYLVCNKKTHPGTTYADRRKAFHTLTPKGMLILAVFSKVCSRLGADLEPL